MLAERYERGSVMLTSNLPFSQWTAIFKDPMTTAATIDRLVHHSVIVELNVPSYLQPNEISCWPNYRAVSVDADGPVLLLWRVREGLRSAECQTFANWH